MGHLPFPTTSSTTDVKWETLETELEDTFRNLFQLPPSSYFSACGSLHSVPILWEFFCLFLCFVFSILDMSKMTQYSSFWTWLVSSIRIANGKIIPLYATVYLCLIFYQVIRWWTLRLTPFPGCWVECDVGRGAGVSSTEWSHLSWPYTQEYNCWITGQFYFWIFLGIFVLPAVAVLV